MVMDCRDRFAGLGALAGPVGDDKLRPGQRVNLKCHVGRLRGRRKWWDSVCHPSSSKSDGASPH